MITAQTPKSLRAFLWISRCEGVSYLLLLGVAMPLKYWADMTLMVKYVGWAHGILFIAYVCQLLWVAFELKWTPIRIVLGFIASLLPVGPFMFERYLSK